MFLFQIFSYFHIANQRSTIGRSIKHLMLKKMYKKRKINNRVKPLNSQLQKVVLFCILINLTIQLNISNLLNPAIQTLSSLCIQDPIYNNSLAYFQNRYTLTVYQTFDGYTITSKAINSINFTALKCVQNSTVLGLTTGNAILQFNIPNSNYVIRNITPLIKDISHIQTSQNSYKIVYLTQNAFYISSAPFNITSNFTSYPLNESLQSIKCSKHRNKSLDGYCFIKPSNKNKIIYFHYSKPYDIKYRMMNQYNVLEIFEDNQKIYVGFESGEVKQYSIYQNQMFFNRVDNVMDGTAIYNIVVDSYRNQLLCYTNASRLVIVSLATGYKVANVSIPINYAELNTQIVFLDEFKVYFFNPILNTYTLDMTSITRQVSSPPDPHLSSLCSLSNNYFNQTTKQCQTCVNGCSRCDQQTSLCFQCSSGFYENHLCIDCRYTSLDSKYYGKCFQTNEIKILQISAAITPLLTTTIQYTYSIFSGSALLFIFMRFINFWSIVSVYYFLNIPSIPYFLLQLLSKIFIILYGSLFQFLNIDISMINMRIDQKKINQKMQLAQISTDFLISNFQSIVVFIYSIFLICILYDGIKKWLRKFKIFIFEKVKVQACLQEFMGIFIPLLVPLSYFLLNLSCLDIQNKINNSLFISFLGIGIIFPFVYVILIAKRITLKQRLQMMKKQIKKISKDKKSTTKIEQYMSSISKLQNKTDKTIQERFFYNKINFLSQQQGQKFLYCLNSFWTSFLVGFQDPSLFLFIILLINIFSVWNSSYAQHWRLNLMIQKLIILLYHICFIILYIYPNSYFVVGLSASVLLIFGGVHELITVVAEKIYFVFLIFKQKKLRSNRVKDINQKQKDGISEMNVNIFDNKTQNSELSIQTPNYSRYESQGRMKITQKFKFISSNHPVLNITVRNLQNKTKQHKRNQLKVKFYDIKNEKSSPISKNEEYEEESHYNSTAKEKTFTRTQIKLNTQQKLSRKKEIFNNTFKDKSNKTQIDDEGTNQTKLNATFNKTLFINRNLQKGMKNYTNQKSQTATQKQSKLDKAELSKAIKTAFNYGFKFKKPKFIQSQSHFNKTQNQTFEPDLNREQKITKNQGEDQHKQTRSHKNFKSIWQMNLFK